MKKIPTTSDEFQEGDNLYPSLHISCSEILYYGIRWTESTVGVHSQSCEWQILCKKSLNYASIMKILKKIFVYSK